MKKLLPLVEAVLLSALLITAATVFVEASTPLRDSRSEPRIGGDLPPNCEQGRQESGAQYRICVPPEGTEWNDDLLVYAHGYVAPDRPVEIPEDQMVLNGVRVDDTITSLGYAFATTSYYTNGLAVRPAISDLLDLVNIFTTTEGIPDHIYLVGVSEGGLITTLSVEQHPEVYDGGLAMCGPYGDFQGQVNHFGDFRVVFDYYFPDLMLGTPITIPRSFQEMWEEDSFFAAEIEPIIASEESVTKVNQLLNVTGVSPYAHVPPTNTAVFTGAVENLLWYNLFATEDAKSKLGGSPFDNEDREYTGSHDDEALNAGVARFSANPQAVDTISESYQTTGELSVPLVTLHTTGDPIVPYRHATEYLSKTLTTDQSRLHAHFGVSRHGHCNFEAGEILGAFLQLVDMVARQHRVFLPITLK